MDTVGATGGPALTRRELDALESQYNLADGHPRIEMTPEQEPVFDSLPHLQRLGHTASYAAVRHDFLRAFFTLAGQPSALADIEHAHVYWSATEAIDCVAKALHLGGLNRCGFVTPTFDSVVGEARLDGLDILPIHERDLQVRRIERLLDGAQLDALWVVNPNNPTGSELSREEFAHLAHVCAERRVILVVDSSFRFYGGLNSWDQYAVLASEPSLQWAMIEDTGKTINAEEDKAGIALVSEGLRPLLEHTTHTLLLSVSPVKLMELTGLIDAEARGREIRGDRRVFASTAIERNRAVLHRALRTTPHLRVTAPRTHLGIELLRIPDEWKAAELCDFLAQQGVSVLPGNPFFWENESRGDKFIRVALGRDPRTFDGAVATLVRGVGAYAALKGVPAPDAHRFASAKLPTGSASPAVDGGLDI